ncbi:hypothetical protein L6R46_12765 [Myxococcota bacterium]|jgi:hypothetical protein|nr:hypothetical protein [Myxococcota bacterium]
MRALLLPLALLVACGTPATSDGLAFSAAYRAQVGAPLTVDLNTSGALVWSVVEAPVGSALWDVPTHEGETFTLTPDVVGDLLLSVERCDSEGCVWGEVVIFAEAGPSRARRAAVVGSVLDDFDPLPDVNDDFDPLPD